MISIFYFLCTPHRAMFVNAYTEETLTFAELWDKAKRLSRALHYELGLPRGFVCGTLLPNCPETYITYLGVR